MASNLSALQIIGNIPQQGIDVTKWKSGTRSFMVLHSDYIILNLFAPQIYPTESQFQVK